MPKTSRVVKPHQCPDPHPLIVRKGDRLSFERKETEFAGWIWCTNDSGKRAWLPENWVDIEGDSCVMKRDYNAIELSIEAGEVLTVELEESGWAWATKEGGESGWVALENLEKLRALRGSRR